MARVKYIYNPETCTYERAKAKPIDILLNLLGFLTLSTIIGIIIAFFFAGYFQSNDEQLLKSENSELRLHIKRLVNEVEYTGSVLQALQKRDDNIYRVIFEADPIPASVRQVGTGGADKYKGFQNLKQKDLLIDTYKKIDALKRKMYVQSKSYDEISSLIKSKSKMLSSMPAIQPISNKQLTRLTSGFGVRMHPIYKVAQFHPGIDFAAPHGTPIYATADGIIKKAGPGGGYGLHVVIDHGYGYQTLYGHMSKFKVKAGEKVKRGQCIGYVGSTGFSTAPHVHYEVIHNKEQVNPVYFFFKDLTDEQYEKILELASIENQSLS